MDFHGLSIFNYCRVPTTFSSGAFRIGPRYIYISLGHIHPSVPRPVPSDRRTRTPTQNRYERFGIISLGINSTQFQEREQRGQPWKSNTAAKPRSSKKAVPTSKALEKHIKLSDTVNTCMSLVKSGETYLHCGGQITCRPPSLGQ